MEIWDPKSPGTLSATPGLLRDCFIFNFYLSSVGKHLQTTWRYIPKGSSLRTVKELNADNDDFVIRKILFSGCFLLYYHFQHSLLAKSV